MLHRLILAAALVAGARVARADEPAAAEAPPKPTKVAVMDLVANGVDVSQVKTLTEILAAEVAGLAGLQVISSADVSAMLGLEKQKVLLGCEADAACVAEIAGALGVDKLVSGSVGRLEKNYVLNLRLIDVKSARAEARAYELVPETLDKLVEVMRKAIPKLFGREGAAAAAGTTPAAKPESKPLTLSTPEPVGAPGSRVPGKPAAAAAVSGAQQQMFWQICGWSGVVVGGLAVLVGAGGFSQGSLEVGGTALLLGGLAAGAGSYVLGWCSPIGCRSPVLMVGYGGVF